MRSRRLLAVSCAALVYGLSAIGGAAARPEGDVPGIPIKAPLNVVEHNVNVYGFFTKAGVNCSDFTGAGVPNSAVRFGNLSVLSHPENGRAGCLVQVATLEFVKAGTIPFQITLTETGADTGTDTINDTALVSGSVQTNTVEEARTMIREAMSSEARAYAALQHFKKSKSVADLETAGADAEQAKLLLDRVSELTLPTPPGGGARGPAFVAARLDGAAALQITIAIKNPHSSLEKGGPVARAEHDLAEADREKEASLKLLG